MRDFILKPPVVFVTGAGISVASGLPTFRGPEPDAVWTQDTMEKGTLAYFHKYPHKQWGWYKDRFSVISDAKPNAAHLVIAQYQERHPDCSIITQNIDGLHTAAGSQHVIEVHGSWTKVRCTSQSCKLGGRRGGLEVGEDFYSHIKGEGTAVIGDIPCCPNCRKPLRPHVLWFDESYTSHDSYRYYDALEAIDESETIIFTGTSFSVGITEKALEMGRWSTKKMICIDPYVETAPRSVELIRGRAEDILLELLKE